MTALSAEKIQLLRQRISKLDQNSRELFKQQLINQGITWSQIFPEDSDDSLEAHTLNKQCSNYPNLSASQWHSWVMQQLYPKSCAYNMALLWRFNGDLDESALEKSLSAIVDRHESLRTSFPLHNGKPYQKINPYNDKSFIHHLTINDNDQNERIQSLAEQQFNLTDGPLFSFNLLNIESHSKALVVVFHHSIADGWSRGIFIKEFIAFYNHFSNQSPLNLDTLTEQVVDLSLKQEQWYKSEEFLQQKNYWVKKLNQFEPLDFPSNINLEANDLSAKVWQSELPIELYVALKKLSRELGVSLFMLTVAAFTILLHKYTQQNDITIGVPTAGRSLDSAQKLIGFFVNTLCLRNEISNEETFVSYLEKMKLTVAEAMENQQIPFAKVVDALGLERSARQNPLFQILFQLQSQSYAQQNNDNISLAGDSLSMQQSLIELTETKFELSWHMIESEKTIKLVIEYRTALFSHQIITDMASHYAQLLTSIIEEPQKNIQDLDIMSKSTTNKIIDKSSNQQNIPELSQSTPIANIALMANINPSNIALYCDGKTITYENLWREVEYLSAALYASYKNTFLDAEALNKQVIIALCLPRSKNMVIALLAIMRLNAAYVPLDPKHPSERLNFIVDNANIEILISNSEIIPLFQVNTPNTKGFQYFNIEKNNADALANKHQPINQLPPISDELNRLAYIMFTSGSTGKPKGVPITIANLQNLLCSMSDQTSISTNSRWLAVTTIAFDIAHLELLLPLMMGSQLVLASDEQLASPATLISLLDDALITHMQATPVTWRLLIDHGWSGNRDLTVLCGGEALDIPLATELFNRCKQLWNVYGPTETTIWSSSININENHLKNSYIPIGEPIKDTSLYILDQHAKPMPDGIAGELCIGGAGLSPGYWKNTLLSDEKFIYPKFLADSEHPRVYRTGDKVIRNTNGEIIFQGRIDFQVKLRGYRIELPEIENVLNRHQAVNLCIVSLITNDERPYLLAYYQLNPNFEINESDIEQELKQLATKYLPSYMLPQYYMQVEDFAVNSNGKIDRKRLPEYQESKYEKEIVAPSTKMEILIHSVWQEILNKQSISIHDNFFDVGGDSIVAMRITSLAKDKGAEIATIQLFENQTIAEQANVATWIKNETVAEIKSNDIDVANQKNSQEQLNQLLGKLKKRS